MGAVLELFADIGRETWHLLLDSSVYIIFGLVIAGVLKMLIQPGTIARHLGRGKVIPVLKAALLGIPLPLCSCGVVPAAAGLKKQGANNGATTAFLISTPESGIDSIAISYALLDPILTIARPVVGFITGAAAGIAENLAGKDLSDTAMEVDLSCPVDGCCDGKTCPPEVHRRHHTLKTKLQSGLRFAFGDLWSELVGWFAVGLVLAGLITAVVPDEWMGAYLGGGLVAMLAMLAVGIPMYICATASTPVAAALILKGVSPGAALVLLLAGPATNLASLTMVLKVLGKRGTAIYLSAIALFAVVSGLVVDWIYGALGVSATATVRQAAEFIPVPLQWLAALVLVGLSIRPLWQRITQRRGHRACHHQGHEHECTSCSEIEVTIKGLD